MVVATVMPLAMALAAVTARHYRLPTAVGRNENGGDKNDAHLIIIIIIIRRCDHNAPKSGVCLSVLRSSCSAARCANPDRLFMKQGSSLQRIGLRQDKTGRATYGGVQETRRVSRGSVNAVVKQECRRVAVAPEARYRGKISKEKDCGTF
jgi:hypothetical protein